MFTAELTDTDAAPANILADGRFTRPCGRVHGRLFFMIAAVYFLQPDSSVPLSLCVFVFVLCLSCPLHSPPPLFQRLIELFSGISTHKKENKETGKKVWKEQTFKLS